MSLRDAHKGALVSTGQSSDIKRKLGPQGAHKIMRPNGVGLNVLNKVATNHEKIQTGRIGFIIDATASREYSWDEAQKTQKNMFQKTAGIGILNLKLLHFGGDEITQYPWTKKTKDVEEKMAKVNCLGGMTQIIGSLSIFLEEDTRTKPNNIILVGDSFEENFDLIKEQAKKLKEQNIKVFSFLDGNSFSAEVAFKYLAEETDGAFAKFGNDLSLSDLCEGVALLSIGGEHALNHLNNLKARRLLTKAPK